jgi:hypothetical protein
MQTDPEVMQTAAPTGDDFAKADASRTGASSGNEDAYS